MRSPSALKQCSFIVGNDVHGAEDPRLGERQGELRQGVRAWATMTAAPWRTGPRLTMGARYRDRGDSDRTRVGAAPPAPITPPLWANVRV